MAIIPQCMASVNKNKVPVVKWIELEFSSHIKEKLSLKA